MAETEDNGAKFEAGLLAQGPCLTCLWNTHAQASRCQAYLPACRHWLCLVRAATGLPCLYHRCFSHDNVLAPDPQEVALYSPFLAEVPRALDWDHKGWGNCS